MQEKNSPIRYIGYLVILLLVFIIGLYFGRQYPSASSLDTDASKTTLVSKASLMIDYGNGVVKTYEDLGLSASTTVFDLLKSTADKNNIKLGYKDFGGDLGVFVETINNIGKDPAGKKWWQYWINNKYSQKGVSAVKVNPGDVVEFKFIQGQE